MNLNKHDFPCSYVYTTKTVDAAPWFLIVFPIVALNVSISLKLDAYMKQFVHKIQDPKNWFSKIY